MSRSNRNKIRLRDVIYKIKDEVFKREGVLIQSQNYCYKGNIVDVIFYQQKKSLLQVRFNTLNMPAELQEVIDDISSLLAFQMQNWLDLKGTEIAFLLMLIEEDGSKVFQGMMSNLILQLEEIGALSIHFHEQPESWIAKISEKGRVAISDLGLMKLS